MDVRCDKCSTEYEFDENRIGANGVTVKCTACGYVFKVRRPNLQPPPRATTTIGKGPQGREWLVRKPDSQMIAFRELTTLQKWIVEGRISRDDEISKNGETWKRLGNIMELEPFFSVYEKARTLNDLIDKSDSEDPMPVELRGSDVVRPAHPTAQLTPPPPMEAAPIIRAEPPIIRADSEPPPPRTTSTPQGRSISTPHGRSISTPGAELVQVEEVQDGQMRAGTESPVVVRSTSGSHSPAPENGSEPGFAAPPPAAPVSNPNQPVSNPNQPVQPERSAPPRATSRPISSGASPISDPHQQVLKKDPPNEDWGDIPPATGFAGPGALNGTGPIQPASFSDTLPPDATGELVEQFERGQKRKKLLAVLLFLILAGGIAGALVAVMGPEGNPVQVLAEKYGLMKQRAPKEDEATPLIEQARKTADIDTLAALQQSEGLLDQALSIRKDDPGIKADKSLLMSTRAGALLRWAQDLERRAAISEKSMADWRAAVEEMKKKKRRKKKALPPEPQVENPEQLKTLSIEKRTAAQTLLKQSFNLVESAYKADPKGLKPARARTSYYFFSQTEGAFKTELARVQKAIEQAQSTDAAILYLEAASTAGDLYKPDVARLTSASALLEKALAVRPTMNRARVLLARIQLAKSQPQIAQAQVKRVLSTAPQHQEAKRLEARAALAMKPPEPKKEEKPAKTEDVEPEEKGFTFWMKKATRLRERDRTKKALNAYDRAAELRPRAVEPLTGMGWCYIDLDKPQAALHVFLRAIKANNGYYEAYYGVAESHRSLKNKAEAIKYYEEYLSRAPRRAPDRRAAERQLKMLRGE